MTDPGTYLEIVEGSSGYASSPLLTDTSHPRRFWGVDDPSQVSTITLAPGDRWRGLVGTPLTPATYLPPVLTDKPIIDVLPGAVSAQLAALTSDCYVRLQPNGDYQLGDFLQGGGNYAGFWPHVFGLTTTVVGDETQRPRVHLPAGVMSAASQAKVPAQGTPGGINPLWAIRLGPNNSSTAAIITCYGIEFVGHDQPVDSRTGLPFDWNGFQCYYWGLGSSMTWCKFTGFGQAHWNSPPGEANILSTFNGGGCTLIGCEATGINGDGTRAGGAFSANGCAVVLWEDCYVHDTLVSGTTFSVTGSPSNMCGSVETHGLKIAHNANHSTNSSGKTFCGINHEGVANSIKHFNPDVQVDNQNAWNIAHSNVDNSFQDCPIVEYIEPVWYDAPAYAKGCWSVQILATYAGAPNKQVTVPTVVKNGVTLQMVDRANAGSVALDPTVHYVLSRT